MITTIFNKTAQILLQTAQKLHLTYNEVNVIAYYMIVPLSWFIMLDFIIGCWPFLSVLWTITSLAVVWWHRRDFSRWCDNIFDKSVDFLLWFRHIGWDYQKASVIICVVLPAVIYGALFISLIH